uniref:Uncharacterized protein n=1 Tax=Physcomitrium patens TaxID=3218 RepID=A0A2K1L7D5_PHYPA|nr:hypothetical protein PHYPA_000380 [Physcomitrium patens]
MATWGGVGPARAQANSTKSKSSGTATFRAHKSAQRASIALQQCESPGGGRCSTSPVHARWQIPALVFPPPRVVFTRLIACLQPPTLSLQFSIENWALVST